MGNENAIHNDTKAKSLMKSVRNARFEFGNLNPQIHEDRNEEVERVERLRETRLIIFWVNWVY